LSAVAQRIGSLTGGFGNAAYYAVAMSVAYNLTPTVIVGTDSVRLETR